jgi:hypothetical protein
MLSSSQVDESYLYTIYVCELFGYVDYEVTLITNQLMYAWAHYM